MARKKSLDQGPVLHERILHSASHLFHERGFAGTSIRDIAYAAEISSSTMYHHFTNKQDVLFEVITRFMSDFNAATVPVLSDTSQSVTDRLRRVISIHIEMSDDRRHELLVGNPVKYALTSHQSRQVVAQQQEYHDAVRLLVEEGCSRGVFDVPDAELATLALLDLLNGIREWFRSTGRLNRAEVVAQYSCFVFRLLASTGAECD